MKTKHRGIHTKPNAGETVNWITPPEILNALGGWASFDTDPCACSPQPFDTARWMIRRPLDGLAERWQGRVWLNPPYGENEHWLERLADHGQGTALVAARTEVERWFVPFIWERATAVLFLFGRLYFYRPDGTKAAGNAGHGSVLAAYGERDARLLKESGLRGRFIPLPPT